MTNETMCVHEALSELKMLDSRVYKLINETNFCGSKKHSAEKVDGIESSQFIGNVKSAYDKITALIARRAAIKRAVVLSNAQAEIEVGGVTYTIAEAIEMKDRGIRNKEALLAQMNNEYNEVKRNIDSKNKNLDDKADNYVCGIYGSKDNKNKSDDVIQARDAYIKSSTIELVDPIGVGAEIEKLSNEIEEFKARIDAAISVSNAKTVINIEY